MRPVAKRHDRTHNQHLASRPERTVACLKDSRSRAFVPVVNNVFQADRVGARWQFEEIAAFDSHSARDPCASECRGRTGCDMWKIEQYSTPRIVL
jgi:hypothetical protein